MSWNKTCIAAESAKDATGRVFKPGDKVAYVCPYSIHTGIVKKINLNDENTIKTVWVTPDPNNARWDASHHEIHIMSEWKTRKQRYSYGEYDWRYRDVVKRIKTPFYNDKLVRIEKIIKID